jgi:hypothetical protein
MFYENLEVFPHRRPDLIKNNIIFNFLSTIEAGPDLACFGP